MPKIKTRKSINSRIKKTKTGKILTQKPGKGHFNSRDTGKKTRHKRKDTEISTTYHKTISKVTPYS